MASELFKKRKKENRKEKGPPELSELTHCVLCGWRKSHLWHCLALIQAFALSTVTNLWWTCTEAVKKQRLCGLGWLDSHWQLIWGSDEIPGRKAFFLFQLLNFFFFWAILGLQRNGAGSASSHVSILTSSLSFLPFLPLSLQLTQYRLLRI